MTTVLGPESSSEAYRRATPTAAPAPRATAGPRATRRLALAGALMVVGFVVLRALNGYGHPSPRLDRATLALLAMSFLNVTKYPPSLLRTVYRLLPEGYGFGLPVVYLVWLGVVAALYPVCRRHAALKARSRAWWLSYL